MAKFESLQALRQFLMDRTAVELGEIREALGGVSSMTAFRHLRELDYRRSYNQNGRFYTLFDATRFDRWGLWTWRDIHFSVSGSLRNTVRRMVHEAEAGVTHRDLQDRLRVRVQNTLASLLKTGDVGRELEGNVFVYVHPDGDARRQQLERRRTVIRAAAEAEAEVTDEIVIEVLLHLIRHPGARSGDVARRLRRRSPPITLAQVETVYSRYDLGQKGGLSRS